MAEEKTSVIAVGEVFVELVRGQGGRFALGYGGDTFNTAVYLARAGVPVAYATALGDDAYSRRIRDFALAEGIEDGLMVSVPERLPGLALVEPDGRGSRLVTSWQHAAPARDLFELPEWGALAQCLLVARLVYFSGTTLALYSNAGLGRFLAVLEVARERGVKVAFDTNYRAESWRGDAGRARTVYAEALKRADIALPSFDDEAALWGDASPDATVARLQAFGIGEIAVKNGTADALVAHAQGAERVPVPELVKAVDPTAAGDGFNAAYLAARLAGEPPEAAALAAHRQAAAVVQHRGAILPRAANAVH